MPSSAPLRVAIATAGRFHVLDLARELHRLGADVRFYSWSPRSQTRRFGLPDRCRVGLLWAMWPLVVWERLAPRLRPALLEALTFFAADALVRLSLRPCDVFVGMSGLFVDAPKSARARFGAKLVLERASLHICDQGEVLAAAGATPPSRLVVNRELAGYGLADVICAPSTQVARSLLCRAIPEGRVAVIPLGVDTDVFRPGRSSAPQGERRRVLCVGQWSLRKGSDVLWTAVQAVEGARLTHVGPVGDAELPHDARFSHVTPLPQEELPAVYAEADVFVLASREDGYGMVVNQALACGLPVVVSAGVGAADLARTPLFAGRMLVVPAGKVEPLTAAIGQALTLGRAPPSQAQLQALSWAGYARRYLALLEQLTGG